jgi:hypothetical protein
MPVIDLVGKGLTELPTDSEDWASATIIILRDNNIRELNTSQLPVTLEYLDLSDNPGLERIIGDFTGFPGLQNLILANTSIRKLPVLPNTLKELDIRGSPVAKGPATTSVLSDIGEIQRYSDELLNIYDTMVDTRGPGIPEKSLVTILEKIQSEEDILYRVETLDYGEQVVPKYYLQAYEPLFASEVLRSSHINPENGLPMVYIPITHAEDTLFEKPVPPNCVYVTVEECGKTTNATLTSKLLNAFKDEPHGMLVMIRDPVKYRRELMAYFGRSLHVHWPDAEHPGNRTYLDSIHHPCSGWNEFTKKCYITKSGIYNLDNRTNFDLDIRDITKKMNELVPNLDCLNITDENLHYIYNDSIFPSLNIVRRKLEFVDRPITYNTLNTQIESFNFTQSWAFKMFPGIHYNFSCRGIKKHADPNERKDRRRRLSLEGKLNNIGKLSNSQVYGELGQRLLVSFVESGQNEMIASLVSRGINVNVRDPSGKTLLEKAISKFQIPVIQELMKKPDIDTTGILEEGGLLDRTTAEFLDGEEDEEEIAGIHKDAETIRKLVARSSGGRRKTRYNKKARRKTRRRAKA